MIAVTDRGEGLDRSIADEVVRGAVLDRGRRPCARRRRGSGSGLHLARQIDRGARRRSCGPTRCRAAAPAPRSASRSAMTCRRSPPGLRRGLSVRAAPGLAPSRNDPYPAFGGSGGLRRAILGDRGRPLGHRVRGRTLRRRPSGPRRGAADPPLGVPLLPGHVGLSPGTRPRRVARLAGRRRLAPGSWRRPGPTLGAGWTVRSPGWRRPGSTPREVGVPSDFYYLAATGPLLSRLTRSDACRAESQQVFLDNAPNFAAGDAGRSPGDYMARGEGTCHVGGRPTRWAYFVAAPGFGPVRRGRHPAVRPLRGRRGDA